MTVGKVLGVLEQTLATCRPEDTLQTLATVLTAKGIGALPVCDEQGGMVGIVSERDIVMAFANKGGIVSSLQVRDVMTKDVISCSLDDTLAHARGLLQKHRFRHLPVVQGSNVVGILSIRDLLEIRLEETELEVNVLKDSVLAARFR